VKINHAILLHGTQGCGKDSLFAPFLWSIGGADQTNVAIVKNEEINRQFEYYLESEVVVFAELYQNENSDRRALENRLKPVIAAPPEHLMMDRKHEHPVEVVNQMLVLAMSNRRDAIALSKEDRRWFVCWTNAPRMAREAADALWDWLLRGGGNAAVAGYLAARDVSAYNPTATPPWTESKAIMLGSSRSVVEGWLIEMIEQRRGEFARGIVSGPWSGVCDRLQAQAPAGSRIFPQTVLQCLAEAGWSDLGMCHSRSNPVKKHLFVAPDYVGSKSAARDALEAGTGGGPLSRVK